MDRDRRRASAPDVHGGVALGARLKLLRQESGMTLDALARESGLSPSQLSRLENGIKRATLDALRPLTDVYAMSLDELVGSPQRDDLYAAPRFVERDGYSYAVLTRRPATLVLVRIASDGTLPLVEHAGSEFVYVLSGQVEIVRNGKAYPLDSKRGFRLIDAQVEHSIGNRSSKEAVVQLLSSEHGERAHF